MARKHLEILGALVLAGGGASLPGLSACTVDNTTYLTITAAHSLAGTCTPDFGNPLLSEGLWDAAVAQGRFDFVTFVEMTNNLPCNSDDCTDDSTEGRLDSNQILLTEIVITYDREGPLAFLPEEASEKKAAMIGSQGGEVEQKVMLGVRMLDSTLAQDFLTKAVTNAGDSIEVLVTVQAKGVLLDDTEVESNQFTFPVTVCNGCLAASLPPECTGGCNPAQPDGITCAVAAGGE